MTKEDAGRENVIELTNDELDGACGGFMGQLGDLATKANLEYIALSKHFNIGGGGVVGDGG
jgi:hypothetical protein